MKAIIDALIDFVKRVLGALPGLIRLLLLLLRRACERKRQYGGKQPMHCLPIPAGVYLRPDASIYSQNYLMSLGMAVTWDNPDVHLTDALNNVVGSHSLKPSTSYTVTATIHNRSNDAPALDMPVVFRLFGFGVGGGTVQEIGSVKVDLPVRGAPGEPVEASVTWTTPPAPGHYCIQIEAVLPDDANPLDNVGQHNTVIQGVSAGRALHLIVPIRNRLQGVRTFAVRHHSYHLPAEPIVRRGLGRRRRDALDDVRADTTREARETDESLQARVVAANRPELFASPPDWAPAVSARRVTLEAEGTTEVEFTATVPASAPAGSRQLFHVSVTEESTERPVGGVTAIFDIT
jgi:hypothetical protein